MTLDLLHRVGALSDEKDALTSNKCTGYQRKFVLDKMTFFLENDALDNIRFPEQTYPKSQG